MSINYAILGLLSYKPLAGYDLKKIMQDSPFMYWSGNNNQIYKVLVELHDEGYVTSETMHQDGSPSRKVYSITHEGLAELKRQSLTSPEAPEIRKDFLVQFAWSWQLSNTELKKMLTQYEHDIKGRLSIETSKKAEGCFNPSRTPRESAVWELIYENIIGIFEQELNWIEKARQVIDQFDDVDNAPESSIIEQNQEIAEMCYRVIEKHNQKYVLLDGDENKIRTEQDGLWLVRICVENGTNLLLIQNERFPDDFLRLGTGVANAVLSRLTTYSIKTAAVIPDKRQNNKFRDFVSKSNRERKFHVYPNMTEAENWLLETNENGKELT